VVTALYVILGLKVNATPSVESVQWLGLIPYLLVIGLALAGVNVVTVLAIGIGVNGIIGWSTGAYDWIGWMTSIGSGIGSMGELIIVSLLAGGMLELIRYNGGLDFIIDGLTRRIRGKRGAYFSVAGLVSLVNFCTANNTIAIITVGPLAKDISDKYGLDPRKTASVLDTFSCLVQGFIPYGAQMLMASGLAGVSAVSITGYLYYPFALGLFAALAIVLRMPRKYS
jgi:Na+/H+ antiporter NhaC